MSEVPNKWSDLLVRIGSAVVMILVGIVGIYQGGHVFHLLVAVICALMVWELVSMIAAGKPALAVQLAAVSGVAVMAASSINLVFALALLVMPVLIGLVQLSQHRAQYAVFALLILLAGFGMIYLRDTMGFFWLLWLVVVVVITDVAGYFAGRFLGGPKFWPAVSPKKTWSGTVAGWIGAGLVGLLFSIHTGMAAPVIGMSIALGIAAQMGDIAESALKRQMGVKDSSALIPGHGGLMDRFDGMLGASVFLLLIGPLFGVPPGPL